MDLESGTFSSVGDDNPFYVQNDDEYTDNIETLAVDELAVKCAEKAAESTKREGRITTRIMIAVSVIFCVAFLLLLFIVLDPLRRLVQQ